MKVTSLPWTGAGAHTGEGDCLKAVQHNRIRSVELIKNQYPHQAHFGGVQDTSNLLPSAKPPSAVGGHLGEFFSSTCNRVLYFEMAMSSESTNDKWGQLGNFPLKHFAD